MVEKLCVVHIQSVDCLPPLNMPVWFYLKSGSMLNVTLGHFQNLEHIVRLCNVSILTAG